MIIGYYPQKLISTFKLNVEVKLGSDVEWLATKYNKVLSATVRAVRQLSNAQLDMEIPGFFGQGTLGQHILRRVLGPPHLARRSAEHGSYSNEDRVAYYASEEIKKIATGEAIRQYGEEVRSEVVSFLKSGDTNAFHRVVPSHFGGEVTVLELLTLILRYSTYHLKHTYYIMETTLGLSLENPATKADLEGIATPIQLF